MSQNNPSMRNLLAVALIAAIVVVPSAASASDGHHSSGHHGGHHDRGHQRWHGGHGYGGHHGRYSYDGRHGGVHLRLSFGHHGSHSRGYRSPGSHNRHGRYGSRYRSLYNGGSGSYGIARHNTAAPWRLLAAGRYYDAQLAFGRQASSEPGNSVPKVGYALASALSGDLDKGVWAMRRALESNLYALEYLTVSQELRPKLEHLVHDYAHRADARFMIACLHQLLGDGGSGY